MPATVLNLVIEQGTTFSRLVSVTDPATGAIVDITGYVARLMVRSQVSTPNPPLLSLTSSPAAGLTVTGAAGTVTILQTATQTAALTWTEGVYDMEIESAGGVVTRLISGRITVSPEVTR